MIITLNICSLSIKNVKQPLLFRMDFAQCYKFGINWDHTGASYIWYKGRKLTSAWHNSAMPQYATGIDINTTSNRLGIRLVTTMTITILPHHVAIILVAPSSHSLHSTNITTELVEVIENPLLYVGQPYLCVIDTLHRFYDRH